MYKTEKHILLLILLCSCLNIISCDSTESNEDETRTEWKCGTHNGKVLWTGPQGGCYYKNSNGNKTYVDRSECNC